MPNITTNQFARETAVLRDLSHRVLEAAAHPKYAERKRLWTLHNSLERTRPLVLMSCGRYAAYEYELIRHECSDPVLHDVEFQLRHKLFMDWIDDDAVIKPWVQVNAVSGDPGWGVQGVNMHGPEGAVGDAYKLASEPAITPADTIQKTLRIPRHTIDETATRAKVDMVRGALGDILPVVEDRTTPHTTFLADLS